MKRVVEQFLKLVDEPKSETVLASRIRHGAQELDTLIVPLAADLRYGPGGGFGFLLLLHMDSSAEEH